MWWARGVAGGLVGGGGLDGRRAGGVMKTPRSVIRDRIRPACYHSQYTKIYVLCCY